jgi:hypothetical protein
MSLVDVDTEYSKYTVHVNTKECELTSERQERSGSYFDVLKSRVPMNVWKINGVCVTLFKVTKFCTLKRDLSNSAHAQKANSLLTFEGTKKKIEVINPESRPGSCFLLNLNQALDLGVF